MKHTTTDSGVGSGDGRDESELRGCRSVLKISGGEGRVGIQSLATVHRACGAASRGVVQRGGWPARINGEMPIEGGVVKGRRHRRLGRCDRVSVEIGGARALVPAPSRIDRWAVQPRSMSWKGQGSERRRRGRLGAEVAVSVLRTVSGRCGLGRAASSSLLVRGSWVVSGAAQSSLSNYRLKLAVRGRPTPESRPRSRAAP